MTGRAGRSYRIDVDFKLSGIVGEALHTWDVPEGETRVGRSSDLQVSLPDRSVSRMHALLRRTGDVVVLEDVGSRNGTSVNGVRVRGSQRLQPEDRISFGNVTLRLVTQELPVQPTLSEHAQLDSTFKLQWKDVRAPAPAESREPASMFQVLSDMGEFLVRHQPQEEIFEACLDSVEKLVPFQRACLLLLNAAGQPELRAARVKGESTNLNELALSQTMVATVIHERASLLVRDAQTDTRFQLQESVILGKIRSALVAPLFDNTSVIGVLYADTRELTVAYDKDHLRQLALLANILAVKITNSRLLEVQREKERMQQEMETAARIQSTLLPRDPAPPAGYELAVRLVPCTEVGGDLYDVLQLPGGRTLFVLGDVSGHGVGAAMLMANAMAGVRALAELCDEPVELVSRLHDQMCRSTDPMSYVTMFVGVLDPVRHRLDFVNAGHESPALIRPDQPPLRLASTGPPVGMIAGMTFDAGSVDFPPGALLGAWSDGISEAHVLRPDGGDPDFFGEVESIEALLSSLSGLPIAEITTQIFAKLERFLQGQGAPDDVTLFLLRRIR